MKHTILAAALLAVIALGVSSAPQATNAPDILDAIAHVEHDSPEVSTAELIEALETGSAVVIDARPREQYDLGHIPGSLFLPGKPGMPASKHTADAAQAHTLADAGDALILYCNGVNCGKTRRLADDLLAAGYTNVRRYQLGIPVWRALGYVTRVDPAAAARVLAEDPTAALIDARSPGAFAEGSAPGAVNVPPDQVIPAEDDGRLPMLDHNTRLFVVAADEAEARAGAEALTAKGFHNVGFIAGDVGDLRAAMTP